MRRTAVVVLAVAAVAIACTRKRNEGAACEDSSDCGGALECVDRRCAISASVQREMAAQSGVEVQAERPAIAGGPGAVRVRSTYGRNLAIAVCAPDERLLGGWCEGATSQGATGFTEQDTLGARWKCSYHGPLTGGVTVHAHAFCQRAAPATEAPPRHAGPGDAGPGDARPGDAGSP